MPALSRRPWAPSALLLLAVLALPASGAPRGDAAMPSSGAPAYFRFDAPPDPATFIFETRDPALIAEARAILAGQRASRHIMGRLVKRPAPYNPPWSYQLDPESIAFFSSATEVCDAAIAGVEAHLAEACGSFLPGCVWCPWRSRLVAEVRPGQRTFLPLSLR